MNRSTLRRLAPPLSILLAPLVAPLAAACGDDGGDGSIVVSAFALEEARTGISPQQTADGFAVDFDHVVLALQDFSARSADGDDAELPSRAALVELVPRAAEVFTFEGVPARRWDEVGFDSRPPDADIPSANDVDPAIAERMVSEGWSQFISGTITDPDGGTYPFELGFPVESTYRRCRSGRDGTSGVVVPANGTAEVEITWHLTHLFFDSFAEDSSLRIEPFAAAWDGESPIDFDALASQDLADLRGLDGEPLLDDQGNPVLYIPPPGGAETLREHVLAARFGHFDGLEGFCNTQVTVVE